MIAASNEVALLPCPFCGSPAVIDRGKIAVSVGCDLFECPSRECYTAGPKEDEPRIIEKWNTRAHSDPRPVAEGLREALELLRDDDADPYSFSGDGDDQGQCITQHKFFRWGDDCVIAIGELNYPNQWDDEAFDAKVGALKAALATHSPAPMAREDDDLTWFSAQRRLSLSFYSPMYGDDDDQSEEWRVHKESGPINDREWDIVGRGSTAAEAIAAARAAAHPSTQEGGK